MLLNADDSTFDLSVFMAVCQQRACKSCLNNNTISNNTFCKYTVKKYNGTA